MIQNDPPFNRAILGILFTTLFFIVSSFTLTVIASPYIVGDLGGDRTITSYGLSFFGFGTAMSIPLARPLAARWGERKTLILSVLLFGLMNLLCGFASTYFYFVSARLLTGFVSGPFYPLLANFFSRFVPPSKKVLVQSIFVTILVVVPVLGACWSGTIAYLFHWSLPFFVNTAAALLLSALLYHSLENSPMEASIDWMGWSFYAFGIFCLTFAIATAQQLDWYRSPLWTASLITGLLAFGYYLVRSFTHDTPVLNLRLLKKPIFTLALLCLALLFGCYFGMILLLSLWLKLDVQFTPNWIAILIGHMAIAGLFPLFILEEKFGHIDPRIWLLLATTLLAGSCFYTTIFDQETNFGRIALSRIIAGFGLALFLPPIFQILSRCYDGSKWNEVFAIFQCVRNLACGIGASLFSIAWERRSVFYHERLNENLSLQTNAVETFLDNTATLQAPGFPLAYLNDFLNKTASSLALDDLFYLMGWILTALIVLLLCTFLFQRDHFNLSKIQSNEETHREKTH